MRLPEISMGRCPCFAKLPRRRRGQDPRLSPHLTAPKEPQAPQVDHRDHLNHLNSLNLYLNLDLDLMHLDKQGQIVDVLCDRLPFEPVHPEDPTRQANVTEVPSIPK